MKVHEVMRRIVKEICTETGTKQKYWAEKCGYNDKQFSVLINGYKKVEEEDIVKFCAGFDKRPDDLFVGRIKLKTSKETQTI